MMIALEIHLQGDGSLNEMVAGKTINAAADDAVLHVSRLPNATARGLSSVALAFELKDGSIAFIETTAALFINAANAVRVADEVAASHAAARLSGSDTDSTTAQE